MEYDETTETCVLAGAHLTDVDEDGYCNICGHQESTAEIEAAIFAAASDG